MEDKGDPQKVVPGAFGEAQLNLLSSLLSFIQFPESYGAQADVQADEDMVHDILKAGNEFVIVHPYDA